MICKSCSIILDDAFRLKNTTIRSQQELSSIILKLQHSLPTIDHCNLEDDTNPSEYFDEVEMNDTDTDDDQENLKITVPKAEKVTDLPISKSISEKNLNTDEGSEADQKPTQNATRKMPKRLAKTPQPPQIKFVAVKKPKVKKKRSPKKKENPMSLEIKRAKLEALMKDMDVLRCVTCADVTFDTFRELTYHAKHVHDAHKRSYFKCCDRVFRGSMAFEHMEIHLNSDAHKCIDCDKTYASRQHLLLHQRNVHGRIISLGHKCSACGKGFRIRSLLEAHVKQHHTMDTSFVCEICGVASKTRGNLKNHIKNVHMERRTEPCTICGKHVFNVSGHIKSMHDFKTMECEICGKTIKSKNHATHMKTNHVDTKKPCPYCGKEFKTSFLQRHVNTHLGVKKDCYFCPAQATDSGNLVKHLNQVHPVEYAEYKAKKFSGQQVKNV